MFESLRETLEKIEHHAYNYKELKACVESQKFNDVKMRFFPYSALPKNLTLDYFFRDGVNCAAILLPLTAKCQKVYHWAGLIKHEGIEFFESFALSYHQLNDYLGGFSGLMDLLIKNDVPRNHTQLQSKLHHEATCGAHLICRFCLGLKQTNVEYARSLTRMQTRGLDADKIVTMLTLWVNFPLNKR